MYLKQKTIFVFFIFSSFFYGNSYGACGNVENININGNIRSAIISWTSTSNNTLHTILRYKEQSSSTWNYYNVIGNSFYLPGLASLTTYDVELADTCANEPVNYRVESFTTEDAIIEPPQNECFAAINLTASIISNNSISLSWQEESGLTNGFLLRYKKKQQDSTQWIYAYSQATSKTIENIEQGIDYEFQVGVICNQFLLEVRDHNFYTDSYDFTIPSSGICYVSPSSVAPSFISTNSATLTWAAEGLPVSFNVQYRSLGAIDWEYSVDGISTSSVNLTNLEYSTSYEYRIEAVCTGTLTSYTQAYTFSTDTIFCPTPSNLVVNTTSLTSTSASFTWDAVSQARSYIFNYKKEGQTTWSSASALSNNAVIYSFTPATNYSITVASRCGSAYIINNSLTSSIVQFTTLPSNNTSVNEADLGNYFNMYPNPTNDFLFIQLKENIHQNIFTIKIEDVLGNIVLEKAVLESKSGIDLSGFKQGIYFVTLKTNTVQATKKLILQ